MYIYNERNKENEKKKKKYFCSKCNNLLKSSYQLYTVRTNIENLNGKTLSVEQFVLKTSQKYICQRMPPKPQSILRNVHAAVIVNCKCYGCEVEASRGNNRLTTKQNTVCWNCLKMLL